MALKRRSRPTTGATTSATTSATSRAALLSGGAALLLAALLVVMLNVVGWKYHQRFDWTGEQLYSLSEKTRNVLASLDRDIEVVVLLSPEDPAWEATREILARYEAASPRLSVRYVDPGRNLLEAQQLVDRYQLQDAAVVFDDGDDRRVVAAPDLTEYDFSALQSQGAPEVAAFRGEQRFTRALLDLTAGEKPRVLFTTGHGEISLDDTSQAGLGEAKRLLGDDNFELEEWASLGAAEVPEGTDLIVVAGPTASFLPPELELFDGYLGGGGRMLLLLDPVLSAAAGDRTEDGSGAAAAPTAALTAWLSGYGVEVGDEVVVDPANPLPFFGLGTQFADRYPGDHPITRSVRQGGVPVLTSLARPVGLADVPPDLEAAVLLESSPEGWGESDPERVERGADDRPGPVSLGVVVVGGAASDSGAGDLEDDPEGGLRLVVFGDSDFASDQLLAANSGNAALLADTLNWMVEREAALGIPPKRPEVVRLSLTTSQVRWTYLLVLVLLPGLCILAGVLVHYRRRR